jgi:dTDP-glucose pyrophosphorylase
MEKENWEKLIILDNANMSMAIYQLNETGKRCLFVVDDNGLLKGSLSDGDLRRAIINGLNMESNVKDFMNPNPLVAPEGIARAVAVSLMETNGIQQIPVVNKDMQLIGLYEWNLNNLINTRKNTMVIMAGGEGTRMRPNTENCPKPLLNVAGRPILEHIINAGKKSGIREYLIAIRYLGHMIEDYFGNGTSLGVHIEYIREDERSGTAGALAHIQEHSDSPFIVTNGDVITDISYGDVLDFHLHHRAFATIAARSYEWQNPYGVVHMNGLDVTMIEEKPLVRSYINTGVYILDPEAIKYLPEKAYCDMPELLGQLINHQRRIIAYPVHENWLDIGNPSELEMANSIKRLYYKIT